MTVNLFKKDKTEYTNKQEIAVCLTACGVIVVCQHIVSLFNGTLRSFITLPFKLDTLFIYGVFLFVILFSIRTILARYSPFMLGIIAFFLLDI